MAVAIHPYYFSFRKRLLDIVGASALLVATLPLVALASLWVIAVNGWPFWYRQQRWGQHRRPFQLLKIRSMVWQADRLRRHYAHLNQAPGPMFKIFDDPRFFKGGRWLSASGLDELPQLWQVLSGHMSLVGPRPLPNGEAAQLPATWQFRWQVKPGLFSEWTVDNQRHQSLKLWRELELATLQQGGWRYDLGLVGRTLQQIVAAHWPK